MADQEPRIPSTEDIRRLFEQLPTNHFPEGGSDVPPPAGGQGETPDEQ